MNHEHKTLLYAGGALGAGALATWYFLGPSSRRRLEQKATTFDAYLTVATQNPCTSTPPASTSFDAYLTNRNIGTAHFPQPTNNDANNKDIPSNSCPVTVLFGTEYGLSKEIAEKACEQLKQTHTGLCPILLDMADNPNGLQSLNSTTCQALLVVCSTHGDGVPPAPAREFCDWIHSSKAPSLLLSSSVAEEDTTKNQVVEFSVCALGDSSYTHFCRCGRLLEERLTALGGRAFVPRADINKEDWKGIHAWLDKVVGVLIERKMEGGLRSFEELGGVEAVYKNLNNDNNDGDDDGSSSVGGRKQWKRNRPYYGRVVEVEGLCTVASKDDKNTVRVEIDIGNSGIQYTPGDALGVWPTNSSSAVDDLLHLLQPQQPLPLPLNTPNNNTTTTGTTNSTTTSTTTSTSEDSTTTAATMMVPIPTWHYTDGLIPEGATSMPVEDALARCYDLKTPKVELLKLLQRKLTTLLVDNSIGGSSNGTTIDIKTYTNGGSNGYTHSQNNKPTTNGSTTPTSNDVNNNVPTKPTNNDTTRTIINNKLEALTALLAADNQPTTLQTYLNHRHIIDILTDWQPATLSITELLPTLRQLQPRLYSISSSQLETPTRVQITVAEVGSTCCISGKNVQRSGVCSTQLASLEKSSSSSSTISKVSMLPVYVHRNPDFRLPVDESRPIIMVGPGTGLAPFRAFIMERLLLYSTNNINHDRQQQQQHQGVDAEEEEKELGEAVLYFGCRRRDQDFLYGQTLTNWAQNNVITLHTAFSREIPPSGGGDNCCSTKKKVYVQDKIAQSADKVWELIHEERGHFYVCGDAKSMAGAVEATLLNVFEDKLGGSRERAEKYLEELVKEGRYQRDVWY